MKNKLVLLLSILCTALLVSCSDDSKVLDHLEDFKEGKWERSNVLTSTLNIEDTTESYDISFFVRHEMDYGYYNLFANIALSSDTTTILTQTKEFHLFDAMTGSPNAGSTFLTGKKLGGQYDHEFPLFKKIRFKEAGTYTITITQMMRDEDSLEGINAVGLKVYTSE